MQRSTMGLIVALACGMLAALLAATAQPVGKIQRIGVLTAASQGDARAAHAWEGFQHTLRDLGWVEGQNVAFEFRFAEGQLERFPALAAELVQLHVDVIVAGGNIATRAAKHGTSTIPVVMMTGDPVGEGFVASLAHPGGNMTGSGWSSSRRRSPTSRASQCGRSRRCHDIGAWCKTSLWQVDRSGWSCTCWSYAVLTSSRAPSPP
jgi:ABC-type uncharacterized transport system substrate-binding protein